MPGLWHTHRGDSLRQYPHLLLPELSGEWKDSFRPSFLDHALNPHCVS
ncbi:unnamed protein product, partial [marine sediment metagenome]